MRQNPAFSSRVQAGGRPMPAWFSESLVNQARQTPPLPPLPAEPPPAEESEYEEIEHLPRYSNTNMRKSSGSKKSCDLCGNSQAVVRCEMCANQVFCGSCNEMYHRHPKRHNHTRKLLDNLETRPPLPPKVVTQLLASPQAPVAPPRRNRRFGGLRSGNSSPTMGVKFPFDPMGSLKRFVGGMGQRPLPFPPTQNKTTQPLPSAANDRRHSVPHPPMIPNRLPPQRSSSITNNILPVTSGSSGIARACIPLTVLELSGRTTQQHQRQNQSMSVANLQEKHPSRDSGYRGWEDDDEDLFSRSHSISASNLNNFPTSQAQHPHFATLQRGMRHSSKPPLRPPPPVPPKDFVLAQHQQQRLQSASVFELNRLGRANSPWTCQHPASNWEFQNQQAMRMGYPGTLQRTSSTSSQGRAKDEAFGWGPVGPFVPLMSQSEMELELLARRGSMPRDMPCYGNQGLANNSNNSRPTGSLRRKSPQIQRQGSTRRSQSMIRHVDSPTRFNTIEAIVKNNSREPEGEYYSGEYPIPRNNPTTNSPPEHRVINDEDEEEDEVDLDAFTESPQGPWSCEHCTFVNPKSTRVCTICCKTPLKGYKLPSSQGSISKIKSSPRENGPNARQPKVKPHRNYNPREDENVEELAPVVKSKLSFSNNTKATKDQRINMSTEQIRKPPPWSTTSSSFDNINSESDSEEEEELNQKKQKYPNSKNKSKQHGHLNHQSVAKIGNSNEEVYGSVSVPIKSWNHQNSKSKEKDMTPITVSTKRVSTGVGSSPPKYMVDSGVGDSPIHDTDKNQYPSHALTQLSNLVPIVTPTKTSQSSSTSTSTSMSISPSLFSMKDSETEKSSRGTSPPPQTISTQTYEELPPPKLERQKSVSKSSMQSGFSVSGDISPPPKNVEMSEKALRYARRAQQQTKLKRSLSSHIPTSNSNDSWVDLGHHHHEGRHLYRSSSRHSLASDTRSLPISGPPSRDISPPPRGRFHDDLSRFPPPSWDRFPSPADYFASVDDLVGRKRRESIRSQEFELSLLLKEAEEFSYTPEDLQVALRMCGDRNPVKWLQENWSNMIETVQTLGTKYGREKGNELNEVGTISSSEAKEALRLHRGNVWAAVTECVEQRRKKFLELQSRGTFLREDILTALTANHGNLDAAYVELSKAQLKPFLMRIWGPPNGLDNNESYSRSPSIISLESELAHRIGNRSNVPPETSLHAAPTPPVVLSTKDVPKELEQVVTKSVKPSEVVNKAVPPSLIKSDGEEERFDDALSGPEGSIEQNLHKIANIKLSSSIQPVEDPTSSDPELDAVDEVEAEAHISHFIQNFDISEPKAVLNLAPLDCASNPTTPTTSSVCSPICEVSQIKEPLNVNSKTQVNENTFPEIASLTMAVNAISVQLQTFLKQQETPSTCPSSPMDLIRIIDSVPATPSSSNPFKENQTKQSLPISESIAENKSTNSENRSSPASTNSGIEDHEPIEGLKNINQEDLKNSKIMHKNRPRSIDLDPLAEAKRTPSPGILAEVKNGPYKLYEAIGNLAGTFLKSAMKTDQGKNPATEVSNEKIYETIQIPMGGITKESAPAPPVIDYREPKEEDANIVTLTDKSIRENLPSISHSPNLTATLDVDVGVDDGVHLLNASENFLEDEEDEVDGIDDDNSNSSYSYEDENPTATATATTVTGNTLKEFLSTKNMEDDSDGESGGEVELEVEEDEHESSLESGGESSQSESSLQESLSDGIFEDEIAQYEQSAEDDEGQIYEEINLSTQPGPSENQEKGKVKTKESGEASKFVKPVLTDSTPAQNEIKRLMKTGLANSYETAEIALKLMDMHFAEEDSLYAAKECSSLYSAISFLQQECLLCAGKQSAKQMVSMLRCTHRCCRTCAAGYFMVQIRDHPIVESVCPFCKEPSSLSDDPELATDYFSNLDMLLKDLLDNRYHEMFQRKLRDWTLAKTPNFKWCSKCSSGFITDPSQSQTHLVCPDCSAVTCAICLLPWDRENHNHRDRGMERSNSTFSLPGEVIPSTTNQSIIDYLNQNCIECPRCFLKFTLARGGCMHLTCSQCCFEFCSGCLAPFRIGSKCTRNLPFCVKLGLHAHHPRNCLFYLRDKEPETLIKLLEEKEIAYFKETALNEDAEKKENGVRKARKCQVPIQKESDDGLLDDLCGQEVLKGYSTVCQAHFVEYLGLLVWQNRLDPLSILSNDDLETIIKREDKKVPGRVYGTKDADYRPLLVKVIETEIPLA